MAVILVDFQWFSWTTTFLVVQCILLRIYVSKNSPATNSHNRNPKSLMIKVMKSNDDSTMSASAARSSDMESTTASISAPFSDTSYFSLITATCSDKLNGHTPSKRHNNSLEDFTINKLRFDSLGLYGRDEEIEMLRESYERSKRKKQLELFAGYSGVGKTCLARTLEQQTSFDNGLYAEGKFDQQFKLNNKPYSAWGMICGNICASILCKDDSSIVVEKMSESLSSELPSLLRVFPVMGEVFGDESSHEDQSESNHSTSEKRISSQNPIEAKASLSFAFARFLRLAAQVLSPMVLVLDDLQWADIPSLELLEVVLMDRELKLLVIGIYRSNEVDNSHILMSSMRDMKKAAMEESTLFDIREIQVGNLELDAIVNFLRDLLSIDDSNISSLASVCAKKTQGNVFFMIHFLQHLNSRELLRYDFGLMRWSWNEKEIEEKMPASENVVDLLLIKMTALDSQTKLALRYAACGGSKFHRNYLALLLWQHWQEEVKEGVHMEDAEARLRIILSTLLLDGYLHPSQNEDDSYFFAHDKIQEAALALTPVDERASFHQWVGQTLLENLGSNGLGSLLFVVVNLLNGSERPRKTSKRIELAYLNSRASKLAMQLSAFDAASGYAATGIDLLRPNLFQTNEYQLTLDLYDEGASAESALGNIAKMEEYYRAVTEREDVPKEAKLPLQSTWLVSLANRGMYREAIADTLTLLEGFNIRFPKSRPLQSIKTLIGISKVSKQIKNGILTNIVDLPRDKDSTRIRLRELMDRFIVYLYYIHDDLMPLVLLRSFKWTLKHGLSDVTPASLTTMAIIYNGILSDLQVGSACAQTALDLIPKVSPWIEGRTLFVAHSFGVIWMQPLRSQLKPLQRGYEMGLSAGDAESACWAIMIFYHIRFLVSFALDLVIADVEVYMAQMKALEQIVCYRSTVVNYQMFMNLAGRTDSDPLTLVGEYCSAENHSSWMKEDAFYAGHCRLWECCIRTWYGKHEECADLVLRYGADTTPKTNPGTFTMAMFEAVSKGISSFVAARTAATRSKRHKYRKAARSIRKRVKSWTQQGNPNLAHLDAFFDAETHALNNKFHSAIKQYQVAIVLAGRAGLLLDAGLFSEILAKYLLSNGDDRDEAAFRLNEAVKYYKSFGAMRKIEMLQKVHPELMESTDP